MAACPLKNEPRSASDLLSGVARSCARTPKRSCLWRRPPFFATVVLHRIGLLCNGLNCQRHICGYLATGESIRRTRGAGVLWKWVKHNVLPAWLLRPPQKKNQDETGVHLDILLGTWGDGGGGVCVLNDSLVANVGSHPGERQDLSWGSIRALWFGKMPCGHAYPSWVSFCRPGGTSCVRHLYQMGPQTPVLAAGDALWLAGGGEMARAVCIPESQWLHCIFGQGVSCPRFPKRSSCRVARLQA